MFDLNKCFFRYAIYLQFLQSAPQLIKNTQKQPAEVFYVKRCSYFTKFTEKHLCQSLFFNKVLGLRPATLLKKRLWHMCFPVNFVKFLRTPFLQNTSGQNTEHSLIDFMIISFHCL